MSVSLGSFELQEIRRNRIADYPASFSRNDINEIEDLFSRVKKIVNRSVNNPFDLENDYFDLVDKLRAKITTKYAFWLEKSHFFKKAKEGINEKIFDKTDQNVYQELLPLANNYVNAVKDLNKALKEDLWSFANLKDKITDIAKKHRIFTEPYSLYVCYYNKDLKKA